MGLFNFLKRSENESSQFGNLQQADPSKLLQPPLSNFNAPSEVNPISKEMNFAGQINKSDPFFVRIDRFNEAKRNLVEIERKIKDMEHVLVKIGETKQKEDEEIESWKRDMKEIRNYLEDINEKVFSKL